MEIKKIGRMVDRLDGLRKFANQLNTLLGKGDTPVVLQIQISLTPEDIMKMQQAGQSISGIMEIVTPDGVRTFEKAVCRLDVDIEDIAPILGDMVGHCTERAIYLSREVRMEAEDEK